VQHYVMLHCNTLHCNAFLQCDILHCNAVLLATVLHCNATLHSDRFTLQRSVALRRSARSVHHATRALVDVLAAARYRHSPYRPPSVSAKAVVPAQ
jgi:hypothetical protein